MSKHAMHHGIEKRLDADGRARYRVRVRRAGSALSATLATPEEALAWRAAALAAAEGRAGPPPKPRPVRREPQPPGRAVTVEDAACRLARGMVQGTIRTRDGLTFKPSVTRKYESALRLDVVPRIGAVPVATLTGGVVQRLVDEIAAERTAEHARKALTALRVALRVAEHYGEVDSNPCARVRVPASREPERPARILTPDEAASMIAVAEAEDARLGRSLAGPLLALALGTGLRLGELLALPWGPDGLDLDAGLVRVGAALDRVRGADGEYARIAPKSRASRRDVPIPPDDVTRLRRHRLATGRPPDRALVFAGRGGEALSPIPAYRAWKRTAKAAGLPEPYPRFHDARHAYASHALAAGLSAHAVAALLGHSDAGLVWRKYGHALPDEVAQAGEALSAWRRARG